MVFLLWTRGTTGRAKEQREEALLFILSMEGGRDFCFPAHPMAHTPTHTHEVWSSQLQRALLKPINKRTKAASVNLT